MGNNDALYSTFVILQIGNVRDHKVYSQHLLIGEHQSAVYYEDIIPIFEDKHILSDFTQATKGNKPQRSLTGPWKSIFATSGTFDISSQSYTSLERFDIILRN